MAPVNGGTGGTGDGRLPGQQQAEGSTGTGEDPPGRASTSTEAGPPGEPTPPPRGQDLLIPPRPAPPATAPPATAPPAAAPPSAAAPAAAAPPTAPPDAAPPPTAPPGAAVPATGLPAGWPTARPGPEHHLLARWASDYVHGHRGQPVNVLYAGCVTAASDLGVAQLQEAGCRLSVSLIEDDQPVTRAAVAANPGLARCTLGDLRVVPLPPRSCDLVLADSLLDRIAHSELVLDRLTAALKPGGLLFLRIRDRDCAAGFLDRVLPAPLRRLTWRARRPGLPGPHPAVYEPLSSCRGVQAYAQLRGLVIVERHPLGGPGNAAAGRSPRGFRAAQRLTGWLSGGRLTAAHEEVLYALRKPEDQFARVL